jgi:PAS domain S-box-containing protein/diguanylate cyclase (GGDEF)-like protein
LDMEHHLAGSHQISLVLLSIFVAVLASYTALDLGSRVTAARGRARRMWLLCGAMAMGIGIWAMHFLAMLALHLKVPIAYHPYRVLLSVLPAVLGSGLALHLISGDTFQTWRLLGGGVLFGGGIATMHYTGMAAIHVQVHYDPVLWTLSVLVAVGAAWVSLYFLFSLRRAAVPFVLWRKLLSAISMGAAIAGMHYTGMAAAEFSAPEVRKFPDGPAMDGTLLAYEIAGATLAILGFVLFGVFLDRRMVMQESKLEWSEERYRSLFQHNPEAVFSLDAEGYVREVNPAGERFLGYSAAELWRMRFLQFVLREDKERLLRQYQQVLGGEAQHAEATLLRQDGKRVQAALTGVPIHQHGEVVGAFVIAQDITERMRQEEAIQYLAFHDKVTGLPNRLFLLQELNGAQAVARLRRHGVALLVIGLERRGAESAGRRRGEEWVLRLAERLQQVVCSWGMVARLSDDVFAVMVPALQQAADGERAAAEVADALQGVKWAESLRAWVGVALDPAAQLAAEELLRQAEAAMNVAKEGGDSYRVYAG